jgi:hypothetical protein
MEIRKIQALDKASTREYRQTCLDASRASSTLTFSFSHLIRIGK